MEVKTLCVNQFTCMKVKRRRFSSMKVIMEVNVYFHDFSVAFIKVNRSKNDCYLYDFVFTFFEVNENKTIMW